MPDLPSARKPPSRFWLYAPYVGLLVVIVVWSLVWLGIRQTLIGQFDQTAARLRAQGWTASWSSRSVGGYPFRLLVKLQQPHFAEPSGWSLSAPALEAEAYAYAPGHWVMVAPRGVTLGRPLAGPAAITGQVLRASITRIDGQAVPQLALEGRGLSLQPAPNAQPLPITRADRLAFYLRPLPGDQAEFQLQLTSATPAPEALLARLGGQQPLNLVWDETLSQVSQISGRDWPSAVRRWSQAGGRASLDHGEIEAGEAKVVAPKGDSTVDASGRLAGALTLDFSHAGATGRQLGGLAHADLTLEDGKIRLGPFAIGKAPRIY